MTSRFICSFVFLFSQISVLSPLFLKPELLLLRMCLARPLTKEVGLRLCKEEALSWNPSCTGWISGLLSGVPGLLGNTTVILYLYDVLDRRKGAGFSLLRVLAY